MVGTYLPRYILISSFLLLTAFSLGRDLNKASALSVACALLEQANAVVLHAGTYEGLGPGEIPSLARLLPKILLNSFQHCVKEQQRGGGSGDLSEQMQASLHQLFTQARGLLENFLLLLERMKIRTVLEDEREIVLGLCADLIAFHKLLVTVDLKSSLKVERGSRFCFST